MNMLDCGFGWYRSSTYMYVVIIEGDFIVWWWMTSYAVCMVTYSTCVLNVSLKFSLHLLRTWHNFKGDYIV